MASGRGATLRSAWAFRRKNKGRSATQFLIPAQVYGDIDPTEKKIWSDWWLEVQSCVAPLAGDGLLKGRVGLPGQPPLPMIRFAWSEGSGEWCTDDSNTYGLQAWYDGGADTWHGTAAKGPFYGVQGPGICTNWSTMYNLTLNAYPAATPGDGVTGGCINWFPDTPGNMEMIISVDSSGHVGISTYLNPTFQWSTAVFPLGGLHQLVLTNADDGTTKLYIDGTLVLTLTDIVNYRDFIRNAYVLNPDPLLNAYLDDMSHYDVTLTPTEVGQLSGIEPGLSASPSLTGDGILSATATASHDRAVALAGSGIQSAVTSQVYANAPGLTGMGSLTATAVPGATRTGDLSGVGTLTAAVSQIYPNVSALSGVGTFSGTVLVNFTPSLAGSGAFAAVRSQVYSPALALTGIGTLSAPATPQFPAVSGLAGSGMLSATKAQVYATTPGLIGPGTLSTTASQIYSPSPVLTGVGVLAAIAIAAGATLGALTGIGSLNATTVAKSAITTDLTGSGTLSATVNPLYTPGLGGFGTLSAILIPQLPGSLTGSGALSATAIPLFQQMVDLISTGALSAAALLRFDSAPALVGVGELTAIAVERAGFSQIRIGADDLVTAYVGNTPVQQIYLGDQEVWSN